jgi:hypothetical protein
MKWCAFSIFGRLLWGLRLLVVVCFLAVVLLWVRSHHDGFALCYRASPFQLDVMCDRGQLKASWGRLVSDYPADEGWRMSWSMRFAGEPPGGLLGFGYERHLTQRPGWDVDGRVVIAPYWFLALLALGPAVWAGRGGARELRHRRSRRRLSQGLCAVCGYDLRAHEPGQRCPECGGTIPADLPRPGAGAVERADDVRSARPQP